MDDAAMNGPVLFSILWVGVIAIGYTWLTNMRVDNLKKRIEELEKNKR